MKLQRSRHEINFMTLLGEDGWLKAVARDRKSIHLAHLHVTATKKRAKTFCEMKLLRYWFFTSSNTFHTFSVVFPSTTFYRSYWCDKMSIIWLSCKHFFIITFCFILSNKQWGWLSSRLHSNDGNHRPLPGKLSEIWRIISIIVNHWKIATVILHKCCVLADKAGMNYNYFCTLDVKNFHHGDLLILTYVYWKLSPAD